MLETHSRKFWSQWCLWRLIEAIVFTMIFFALVIREQGEAANLLDIMRYAAVIIGVYAVVLLYVPLSALLWFFLPKSMSLRTRLNLSSILFVVHGYAALSLMYNGMLGISRVIDFSNSAEISWLGVAVLHGAYLVFGLIGTRK